MLPKAKKHYGQNFLVDKRVVEKILCAADIVPGQIVLEVGPGTGVLTRALVDAGAHVIAVEADQALIEPLRTQFKDSVQIVFGDIRVLHAHITREFSPFGYKLVANIPYYITSELLKLFLTTPPQPASLVLLVQKEVAERITAQPSAMSLLSVMCQLYAECKKVAIIKAGAFRPIPQVDSALVRLDVRHPPLAGLTNQELDPEHVIAFAKRGFSAKRKQLKTNLGASIVPYLEQLELDPKIRAEALSPKQWIDLYCLANF